MLIKSTKYFLSVCFFVCSFAMKAQIDPVFAQFYTAPAMLNPAMIGVYSGSFRFNANYRQQWTDIFSNQPIRTIQAAFDTRIRIIDDDFLALGLNAINDEVGGDGSFKSTKANLGFSYLKQLNGSKYKSSDQYLIAGAQVGLGQQSVNYKSLWYDVQLDPTNTFVHYDWQNGVAVPQSNMYVDFNAGLLWYNLFEENKSIYFGAAMSHINKPNISFYNSPKAAMYRRLTVHGGGEIPFSKELSILPAMVITSQGPSLTTEFGANVRYSNHDWNEAAVRIGAWYRIANSSGTISTAGVKDSIGSPTPVIAGGSSILGDAIIFAGILEINRWQIGISYDVHVSSLSQPTNSRGGFELSLIYVHPYTKSVNTSCPKF